MAFQHYVQLIVGIIIVVITFVWAATYGLHIEDKEYRFCMHAVDSDATSGAARLCAEKYTGITN